jgi:hypothetical protein
MTDSSLEYLIERDLSERYGSSLLGGEALRKELGYPSYEALRQALSRGTVPVSVFTIAHRRGKFALVKDVAAWLARVRKSAPECPQTEEGVPMS